MHSNVEMYKRFSDRARNVLKASNELAYQTNSESIEAEHVLLALLNEGTGVAIKVLEKLRVDFRQLRRYLSDSNRSESCRDNSLVEKMPVSPATHIVTDHAIEEALAMGHNYVGTEHLLLGLMKDEGVAGTSLRRLGLKHESVRDGIQNILAPVQNRNSSAWHTAVLKDIWWSILAATVLGAAMQSWSCLLITFMLLMMLLPIRRRFDQRLPLLVFCIGLASILTSPVKTSAQVNEPSADSIQRANDLFAEAQRLSGSGQLSAAIEKQKRGIKTLEGIPGDPNLTVQFQTFQLGSMLVAQGRPEEGIDLMTQLLEQMDSQGQPNQKSLVAIRLRLGSALVDVRRFQDANKMLLTTLDEAQSLYGHDSMKYSQYASIAAHDFERMGNLSKAEALDRDVVAVTEKLTDCPAQFLAGAHKTLASVLIARNKNAEARLELDRSIAVCRAGGPSCRTMLAVSQYTLAMLHHGQGDFKSAAKQYQTSIGSWRELAPNGSMQCAMVLSAYGVLLTSQGKLNDGMESIFESVEMGAKFKEASWSDFAGILRNASTGAFWSRQYEVSMHCAKKSVELHKAFAGEDDHRTGRALYNVGLASMFMGDDSAEASFRSSIENLEQSLLSGDQDLADAHEGVGIFFASIGKTAEALAHFEMCIRGACQRFNVVLPGLPQPEQELYVDFNLQHLAPVWSFALANNENQSVARASAEWLTNYKWLGYESLARQVKLQQSTKNPLALRLQELRNEIAQLAMYIPSTLQRNEHRKQYDALTQQIDALTRELAVEQGYSESTTLWVTLEDLQRGMPKNSAFIDILRFEPSRFDATTKAVVGSPARYAAWVVHADKGRSVAVIDLGEADLIDERITNIRKRFQETSDREVIRDLGGEDIVARDLNLELRVLAKQVFDPLVSELGGVEELIISPDRNLWLLPWAGLPVNDGDTVLLEKFTIRFVNCGRQLTNIPIPPDGIAGVSVVVGNPDYNAESSNTQASDKSSDSIIEHNGNFELRRRYWAPFKPFNGGDSESNQIGTLLEQYMKMAPELLLGIYANEQKVLTIHRPKVLCFVMHGIVLSDPPPVKSDGQILSMQGSSELRSMKAPNPESSEITTSRNPLLRCGLALSGANVSTATTNSASDGVLTGLEVIGLDLHGTELVVLPACDSAVGELRNGEGVGGLQQAFHLAGARHVLGTLWQVDDRETNTLTISFFENLAKGDSPPRALRSAQLKWLKDRRDLIGTAHPGFWSGLIISGN